MAHRKKQPTRYRLRFNFWLNILNPDEEIVADEIELLKNGRQFAGVVRDGIMIVSQLRKRNTELLTKVFDWLKTPLELWDELQQGRVDLLVSLFPWIKDCFAPPPIAEVARIQSELDFLKALVLAQQHAPAPRPLTPATDDDDTLTVRVDADAGSKSAANFIDSMLRLQ